MKRDPKLLLQESEEGLRDERRLLAQAKDRKEHATVKTRELNVAWYEGRISACKEILGES